MICKSKLYTIAVRSIVAAASILFMAACTNSATQPSNPLSTSLSSEVQTTNINLPPGSHPKEQCPGYGYPGYTPAPAEIERDHLYQLTAYGVVLNNWQTQTWGATPPARGYNIGSILVDNSKPLGSRIVCWARNSVITTGNETQHGEVRLMTNYLGNAGVSSLKSRHGNYFKLYTTLEPCAMCGGMMTLQSLYTTLYGQTDPDYGDGIQRLEVTTHQAGGFCSYPRGVYSRGSTLPIRQEIDTAYHAWQEAGNRGLTSWLTTPEAKALFVKAVHLLQTWPVQFSENQTVKDNAIQYLAGVVPTTYAALPYTVGCDGG